jgi:hypothetical protein
MYDHYLGPDTGYPDWGVSWFSSIPTGKCRDSTLNHAIIASFQIFSSSSFAYQSERRPVISRKKTHWRTESWRFRGRLFEVADPVSIWSASLCADVVGVTSSWRRSKQDRPSIYLGLSSALLTATWRREYKSWVKVKWSRPATRHAGAKGGRGYSSYSFLTLAVDGEWSASRPGRAPLGKGPRYPWLPGWVGLRVVWSQRLLEEKSFASARDRTSVVLFVVRQFFDWATKLTKWWVERCKDAPVTWFKRSPSMSAGRPETLQSGWVCRHSWDVVLQLIRFFARTGNYIL